MPTRKTRLIAGSAALLSAVVLAGCSSSPDPGSTASPTTTSSASPSTSGSTGAAGLEGFYAQKLAWKKCGGSFECADLDVPLDYSDPSGQTIKVAVIKLPASGDDRIGSLVINPGGPGGSGIEYARAARFIFDDSIRARYDIVGFDPRGVGESEKITCLDDKQTDAFLAVDGTPDDDAEVTALEDSTKQFVEACRKNSAALLAHVGTRDAARDIDVLRQALGDEKLNWLGASYGTFLGATYADLFPQNVGRMVLDGAMDPTLTNEELAHGQAKGFELALNRFVEDCQKQSDCPLPRDSVQAGVARIQQFFAGLDTKPIGTGDPARPLTQALGIQSVLSYLYFPPTDWEQLRFGLEMAFEGDGSVLLSMLDARMERSDDGKYKNNPFSSFLTISAADRGDSATPEQSAKLAQEWGKEAPVFGPVLAWGNLVFDYWPVEPTDEPHAIKAPGTGPILVVGTTYDPATPYPWAQSLAKQLEGGVLLTRVGDGHTGYGMGSSCTDRAINTYLLDGTPPAEGTVCKAG